MSASDQHAPHPKRRAAQGLENGEGAGRPAEGPDADVRRVLAAELRSLTHELSQPLAAIVSYARGAQLRLRKNGLQEADLTHVLDAIVTQAERAAAIVRDVDRQRGPS